MKVRPFHQQYSCNLLPISHSAWRVRNFLERIQIGVKICCVSRFSSSLCSPFNNNEEEMWEDLCIRWRTMDLKMLEKAIFFFRVRVNFAFYFDRWINFTLEYLSKTIFSAVKNFLLALLRYSCCFMWNVEMGRTSGRLAARFFCEAIVCGRLSMSLKRFSRRSPANERGC